MSSPSIQQTSEPDWYSPLPPPSTSLETRVAKLEVEQSKMRFKMQMMESELDSVYETLYRKVRLLRKEVDVLRQIVELQGRWIDALTLQPTVYQDSP